MQPPYSPENLESLNKVYASLPVLGGGSIFLEFSLHPSPSVCYSRFTSQFSLHPEKTMKFTHRKEMSVEALP
jgi:hypothetical protein